MIFRKSSKPSLPTANVIILSMNERSPEVKENWKSHFALLEETPGFQALSEKQKASIKHSLYITERGNRPASTVIYHGLSDLIGPVLDEVNDDGSGPDYTKTQEHLVKWYCHAAVLALENEGPLELLPNATSSEFFEGTYEQFADLHELEQKVEEVGFPSIVHISTTPSKEYDPEEDDTKVHSFVVLGKDKKGSFLVWEKVGYGGDYKVSTIEEIYTRFKAEYSSLEGGLWWVVRPLNKPSQQR